MVEYYDDEKDMMLTFITNNFEVSALEVQDCIVIDGRSKYFLNG